ncbi:hemin uptake protein HemP [Salmonella enterica subsp. enterica serovar Portland]|uniref:hemin uptake protein HemP n=1 Tax=Salmonella enterica TaxID=28901 RepID=UPI000FBE2532|nr:hemin uptake protein HemP [Salmonella enterica]EBF8126333.1 hemin uptake protein HemP [Salmonella enterica subsp. enterica]EBG5096490.1 hemin uptake protein HemP [Salmonella enterica subsp. enterica serovar India]EBG5204391.1 hemin uptake protein HemP [Salmonella enterica subsp. enterica serovar Geraldton]EBU7936791.1 hemin uptake protein hemP [Salmonella enterica subsp. enterica serovar Chittagong]EBY5128952.1 hemin uptake protein HemP [Salmonella enterica subsp. enterica serovar Brazzavil
MSRMDNTELPHPKEIDNETLLSAAERRVNSQTLLGPDGKVIIDHNGQEYLLRKTQAGKLLLTK